MLGSILLVEDDDLLREVLTDALADAGWDVIPAADGEQALRALESRQVDVVVTDIVMPVMDGLELIMALRSRGVAKPILAMSGGSASPGDVLRVARAFGAAATLGKPFLPAQLVAAVAALLVADEPA